jgi:hypothetical protein
MSDAKVRTFARFPAGTNPLAALHEAMAANIEGSPGFGSLAKALDHERLVAATTWWLVTRDPIDNDTVGPHYCVSSQKAATVLACSGVMGARVFQVVPWGRVRLGDTLDPETAFIMVEAERVRVVADVTPTTEVVAAVRAELGTGPNRERDQSPGMVVDGYPLYRCARCGKQHFQWSGSVCVCGEPFPPDVAAQNYR